MGGVGNTGFVLSYMTTRSRSELTGTSLTHDPTTMTALTSRTAQISGTHCSAHIRAAGLGHLRTQANACGGTVALEDRGVPSRDFGLRVITRPPRVSSPIGEEIGHVREFVIFR